MGGKRSGAGGGAVAGAEERAEVVGLAPGGGGPEAGGERAGGEQAIRNPVRKS